jgi:hypothetical protein
MWRGVEFAFILSNDKTIFAMIYFALFTLLVAAIALVTNKLNMKSHCTHNWEQQENSFKCCSCGKKIPDLTPAYATETTYTETYREAA